MKSNSPTGPVATDARIQRVGDKANRDVENWCEDAANALRLFSHKRSTFLIEDARESVAEAVGEPEEPRAYGAAARFAIHRRWIERTGQHRSDKWGSPKPVYRRGPNG